MRHMSSGKALNKYRKAAVCFAAVIVTVLLCACDKDDFAVIVSQISSDTAVSETESSRVSQASETVSKPEMSSKTENGGFEQVGSIETSLPREDVQTTTEAGDIVLYSGDQLVVFYGSNSWAYTRLGHITDKTADEMTELLGNGNVTITLSMTE